MDNIQEDNREAWFIDIDGTVVKHNYRPEEVQDEIIPGVLEKLKEIQSRSVVILTSSRSAFHTLLASEYLKSLGFVPDGIISNMPTGARHLVNDNLEGSEIKALAHPVERDKEW